MPDIFCQESFPFPAFPVILCLRLDEIVWSQTMEKRIQIKGKKKLVVVTGGLAVLFTVMQVAGYRIAMYYHTTVHRSAFFQKVGMLSVLQCAIVFVVSFIFWFVVVGLSFLVLDTAKRHTTKYCFGKKDIILWLLFSMLLFLCWMPCYAAGYPGFYNYDAFSQVPQALYEEVPYSAHHPLVHTLLMGKIIAFGYYHGVDLNDGIALHSIFQMAVCALAFSFVICYIRKISGMRRLYLAAFCYYAFFPPVPMFAMSTTKDVLFSVLLQFTVIFLYDMCQDVPSFFKSKKKMFGFFLTAFLMCLFRKNGVYAYACMIPVLILLQKKYVKQILLLCCAVIISYLMADSVLIKTLNAEKASAEEMLCVPIQQLARVYHDYGEEAFSAEELNRIYAGISETDLRGYNPFLADHIKNYFDYRIVQNNKTAFIKLWLRKGFQYPKSYINAFLDNTYQAWYPGTSVISNPVNMQTDYFEMDMRAGGYRDSKMPRLLSFYNKIACEFYYQKIPVIRLFFSIGAMFWVALFTFGYAVYRRNGAVTVSVWMILAYCLTVLAGPVSLVRYYLILFYCFPLCIGFCLERSELMDGCFQ